MSQRHVNIQRKCTIENFMYFSKEAVHFPETDEITDIAKRNTVIKGDKSKA